MNLKSDSSAAALIQRKHKNQISVSQFFTITHTKEFGTSTSIPVKQTLQQETL